MTIWLQNLHNVLSPHAFSFRHANMHVHLHKALISFLLPAKIWAQKTYGPRAEASHSVLCPLIHYIHLTVIYWAPHVPGAARNRQ